MELKACDEHQELPQGVLTLLHNVTNLKSSPFTHKESNL